MRALAHVRRVLPLVLAAGALAGVGMRCVRADPSEVAADAGAPFPDAASADGANPTDAMGDESDSSTCTSDAAASDWPGWRRVVELDCDCHLDATTDSASIPVLAWVPCINGLAGCQQLKFPVRDTLPASFRDAQLAHTAQGAPAQLYLMRAIDDAERIYEYDFFDFQTRTPVAAWRSDLRSATCALAIAQSGGNVALFAPVFARGMFLARGSAASLARAAPFRQIGARSLIGALQSVAVSSTTVAYDVQPGGSVLRSDGSSTAFQASNPSGHPPLILDFVEGGDVFAHAEHGTAQWSEVYRVDSDGSVVLVRANSNAHVIAMRSDGTSLMWTEVYGNQDLSVAQTRVEVWSAPYATDAAVIARTARLIATITPTPDLGVPIHAAALDGAYAVLTSRTRQAFVVRISDGALRVVEPGQGWSFAVPGVAGATGGELWAILTELAGQGRILARIGLTGW